MNSLKLFFFIFAVALFGTLKTYSQDFKADVRTGISFSNSEFQDSSTKVTQSNFVKEAYVGYSRNLKNFKKMSSKFTASVSLWYNGSDISLYTANLAYEHLFNEKTSLRGTIGQFENDFYSNEKNSWNNEFLGYSISTNHFNRNTIGLELKLKTEYFDFSVASTRDSVKSFELNKNEITAVATVRPVKQLSISGVYVNSFRNNTDSNIFGGLANFTQNIKRVGLVNVGVEFLTSVKDSTSSSFSSWLEFTPRKSVVSVLGRYDLMFPNKSNTDVKTSSFTGAVICHPLEEVKLGLFYNRTTMNYGSSLKNSMNKFGLMTQVVF